MLEAFVVYGRDPEALGNIRHALTVVDVDDFGWRRLGYVQVGAVWPQLQADDAAALLTGLSRESRQALRQTLEPSDAAKVRALLAYGEKTAGRRMNPSVVSLPGETVVSDAIQRLRQTSGHRAVFYLYVVDGLGRLEGLVSLRQLVTAVPDTPLLRLMQ